MTRRVKTHIRLGIRSVSPSDQSPRYPLEETLGPYLPVARFRGENPRRNKWFLFFFVEENISHKGCSAAKREEKAFFLGWSVCLHKNSDPRGLSVSAPGLCTCIKTWTIMYKIRLQGYFFETCNNWAKWQDFSVNIRILPTKGCLPLPRGYIWKTFKNVYKIRIQRDLFETCNKWSKWKVLSVDIKCLSPWGFLPLPRGYIHL